MKETARLEEESRQIVTKLSDEARDLVSAGGAAGSAAAQSQQLLLTKRIREVVEHFQEEASKASELIRNLTDDAARELKAAGESEAKIAKDETDAMDADLVARFGDVVKANETDISDENSASSIENLIEVGERCADDLFSTLDVRRESLHKVAKTFFFLARANMVSTLRT